MSILLIPICDRCGTVHDQLHITHNSEHSRSSAAAAELRSHIKERGWGRSKTREDVCPGCKGRRRMASKEGA